MPNITEKEWAKIDDDFDSTDIQKVVRIIDKARGYLNDIDGYKPPQMREDAMEMHGVAMDIMHHHSRDKAKHQALFDHAYDLSMELDDLIELLENAKGILDNLTDLHPDSLNDED
tara:strand:+ start:3456 stop:3800 length:345 start_codon:yes stop_codon:yes gene_type:complete